MSANFTSDPQPHAAVDIATVPVDPRITYPSYKSFDEFIEVERLIALDEYLTEKITDHRDAGARDYFVNEHRLDADEPYMPGIREVWLSRTRPGVPYNYLDLDRTELWQLTPEADDFGLLMDLIDTFPFTARGRMLIIYDDSGAAVPAHRDHLDTSTCNEFIWFRTNLRKPFYMLNEKSGEKLYVDSYSAWFDSVNQYHGCDGGSGLTFSIRVDGVFTDEFRSQIPFPTVNRASTPSLWASLGK